MANGGCRGGIRTCVVTGDYHHTAIAVAKDIGMVKPGTNVIVIETVAQQHLQSQNSVMSSYSGSRPATPRATPQTSLFKQLHNPSHSLQDQPGTASHSLQDQPGTTSCSLQDQPGTTSHSLWQDQPGTTSHSLQDQIAASNAPSQPLQVAFHSAVLAQSQSSQHSSPLRLRGKQVSWVPVLDDHKPDQHAEPDPKASIAGSFMGLGLLSHTWPDESAKPGHSQAATPCLPHNSLVEHHSLRTNPEQVMPALRFLSLGQGQLDAADGLRALAEGMQCAVTGDAFELMLQHHDLSVLETVMQSAVVFSRMQPHQKGQVMDFLGMRGIHQLFNSQPRYIAVRS